jgi:hypothetical protein
VQLLYFHPGLSHPATGPVIATTLGTTFTSPSYYISFSNLHAANGCGAVGPTIGSTIIPFPADATLMSQWAIPTGCLDEEEPYVVTSNIVTATASFNITDILTTPVPLSVLTSGLDCASTMANLCVDYFDPAAMCAGMPYAPILVVPNALLQSLDPSWASCSADIQGLYDPPKVLTPATAESGPTTAIAATSVSATPASGLTTTAPVQTPRPTGGDLTPSLTSDPVESTSPALVQTQPTADDPTTSLGGGQGAGSSNEGDPGSSTDPTSGGSGDPAPPSSAAGGSGSGTGNSGDGANPGSNDGNSNRPSPSPAAGGSGSGSGNNGDGANPGSSSGNNDDSGGQATQPAPSPSNAIGVLTNALQTFTAAAGTGLANSASSAGSSGSTEADSGDPSGSNSDPGDPSSGNESDANTAGGNQAPTLDQSDSLPPAQTVVPSPGGGAVLTGTDGQHITAAKGPSGSIVIGDGTQSTTLAPGQQITTDGITLSAPAGSGGTIVANSRVVALTTPVAVPAAQTAQTFTGTDGNIVTVEQQGGNLVVHNGASTITVAAGHAQVVDGLTISDPTATSLYYLNGSPVSGVQQTFAGSDGQPVTVDQVGGSLVVYNGNSALTLSPGETQVVDGATIGDPAGRSYYVNGSPIAMAQQTPAASGSEYVVTGADGQLVTVLSEGSQVLVEDASTTVMLRPGADIRIDGEIFSLPTTRSGVFIDGILRSLTPVPQPLATESGLVVTGTDGTPFTIVEDGSAVLIEQGSTTLTLLPGSQLDFDGETLSLLSGESDVVVVDGSTVRVTAVATTLGPQVTATTLPGVAVSPEQPTSTSTKSAATSLQAVSLQCLVAVALGALCLMT